MPSVDSLQQDSNQPSHQKYQPPTHVPATFKWTQDWGNHICIAGSFDPPVPTWTPIEMSKDKGVTLDLLPDKKYYYKFVIDGNWVTDGNATAHPDSSGNWNHEIQVELPPPPPLEEEKEEIIIEEQLQQEVVSQENIIVEEKHQEVVSEEKHEEKVVIEEKLEEKVVSEEKHEEKVVIEEKLEEEVVAEEKHEENLQEEVVSEEKHKEEVLVEEKHEEVVNEEKHEKEIVTEEKNEENLQEEVVSEEKHKEEVLVEEKHEEVVNEEKHEKEIVAEEKNEENLQEEVVPEEKHKEEIQKHQEETIAEDHQEDHQVVTEDHQEQAIKEEQYQHQEDQIDNKIEELHQHKDDQKEDQIIEQTLDETIIETETIEPDRTLMSNESSSIVKETIIDDVIIEGTQNESMTTHETLHTSQNDTEPINVINENVEEVTAQHNINAEISEIEGPSKEFKVSDETTELENKEFKVSDETTETIEQSEDLINESKITTKETSTTDEKEIEIPIESSSFSVTTEVSHEEKIYEPEHETINEEYDQYEENETDHDHKKEEAREIRENIKTEVICDENLPESTLKEVLLNSTWAKDESHEDSVPSSWTESHESQNVVWPEDSNLEWSDIDKEQKTHESEEVISREISSTVLVGETMTEQVESIVEETLTQSIVESHIEQEKESDETGISITSEVKEPSFAQYEKPESSATADEVSATPTTVVEEIVTSKAIDKLKSDDMSEKLEVNISRKIISISPSTSSPGESTRNADMYTHNITVATNANIHKKPVEITSRGILENDSKDDIPNDGCEEEKVELNDLAFLVTSVATTFTLGVISMLYSSVFRTKSK